jgi:phosphate/sulfate permease
MNRFSLQLRDWLKGLIIAVGTPVLYLMQELIPNWNLTPIEKAALSAFVTYMLKNLFTDDVKAAKKTLVKAKEIEKKAEEKQQQKNDYPE